MFKNDVENTDKTSDESGKPDSDDNVPLTSKLKEDEQITVLKNEKIRLTKILREKEERIRKLKLVKLYREKVSTTVYYFLPIKELQIEMVRRLF